MDNNEYINNYDRNVYHCYLGIVNAVVFRKEIFRTLQKYNYANIRLIAQVMKANPFHVKKCLQDGIVIYCHENPRQPINVVIDSLKVKSSYILELIEENRLDLINKDMLDLEEILSREKESEKRNELLRKQELVKSLSNAFDNSIEKDLNDSPRYRFKK